MSMREEYQAWLLEVHGLTSEWDEERNCFKDYPAHLAYKAWQASRAALIVELPDPYRPIAPGVPMLSTASAANEMRERCRESIEAAGVRVKP